MPPATPPTPISEEAYPWCCARHPRGIDVPCHACEVARKNWQGEKWNAVPTPKGRRYDPTIYCEHLQLLDQCETCEAEARRAAAVLERQFGMTDD